MDGMLRRWHGNRLIVVLWAVTPCGLAGAHQCSGGTYRLQLQGWSETDWGSVVKKKNINVWSTKDSNTMKLLGKLQNQWLNQVSSGEGWELLRITDAIWRWPDNTNNTVIIISPVKWPQVNFLGSQFPFVLNFTVKKLYIMLCVQ